MKVKLLVSRSGRDGSFSRNEIIDVSDAEGARMIAAGQAEPVAAKKKEKATKKPANPFSTATKE